MKKNTSILLVVLLSFVVISCDRNRNHPGWDYFPDMFYSTAYETYTENPNFPDSMTMRVPPAGSVPQGYIPFPYTIDAASRSLAGAELINPLNPSPGEISRGKDQYEIFCMVCHGPGAQGDGTIFKLGLYPMKPRVLAGQGAQVLRDGEIYHTITLGFGSMGSYASQVQPDDRWRIVMYIRQLQEEQSK